MIIDTLVAQQSNTRELKCYMKAVKNICDSFCARSDISLTERRVRCEITFINPACTIFLVNEQTRETGKLQWEIYVLILVMIT